MTDNVRHLAWATI